MSEQKIISSWEKGRYSPVYWLEGEEDFFIDQITSYAEQSILTPSEKQFNLTIFYGKDASWSDVINACMRYPMFADKQVVLLKEAQQMKDIDKLESYISKPLSSTILIVSYKGKTLDKRSRLAKVLKENVEVFLSQKVYENKLGKWVADFIESKGFTITHGALTLLIEHIGNDLSRISNEIDKLSLNLNKRINITEDDIENFVGISKDYNISELQKAFGNKDLGKAITIIQYIENNPKAIPVQMLLPGLYNYFSKILMVHRMSDRSEAAIKHLFFYNSFLAKEALTTVVNYDFRTLERAIMILHEYNLKSIGVNSTNISPGQLLKEMAVKIISN